jgi:hypothetical protein
MIEGMQSREIGRIGPFTTATPHDWQLTHG